MRSAYSSASAWTPRARVRLLQTGRPQNPSQGPETPCVHAETLSNQTARRLSRHIYVDGNQALLAAHMPMHAARLTRAD